MQIRFECPACKRSHVLDMPATTIHLTCSQTGRHLELKLGHSGDVKVRLLSEQEQAGSEK